MIIFLALINNCSGSFSVLKNRVKLHHRKVRRAAHSKSSSECLYEYIIVVDFEATCQSTKGHTYYPHEIIEFPAVAIHVPTLTVVCLNCIYIFSTIFTIN